MNLKKYLESLRGKEIGIHTINDQKLTGIVSNVGDDFVELEVGDEKRLCPYHAISFVRIWE